MGARVRGWLALGALCFVACGEPSGSPGAARGPARPNVLLVVIDTLRADHLGAWGYARPTSPHIDALAARGVLFTRAFAPSSWTRPSVASLFTSLYPSEHGATTFDRPLSSAVATLAERFRDAGYRTLGVSGNFTHVTEEIGFGRGFERWSTLAIEISEDESEFIGQKAGLFGVRKLKAPTGFEVNDEVLRLLPAGEAPLFLYVHYMDPHSGYTPPSPFRERFVRDRELLARPHLGSDPNLGNLAVGKVTIGARMRRHLIDLYDGEIATVDAAFGALLAELHARGLDHPTVTALVSDHGEEFDEHGNYFHGLGLHHEAVHVPLVLHDSRAPDSGARRDEPVDLLDVGPTLLALAGLEKAPGMRGRNLLDGSGPLPPRDLLAELHYDELLESIRPRSHDFALQRWPWKVITHREAPSEWFRKDRDLGEQAPLDAEAPGVPRELADEGRRFQAGLVSRATEGPIELDAEDRDRLRALGYLE